MIHLEKHMDLQKILRVPYAEKYFIKHDQIKNSVAIIVRQNRMKRRKNAHAIIVAFYLRENFLILKMQQIIFVQRDAKLNT